MSFYVSTATFVLLHCDEWDRVVALPRHKFVTGATLLQLGLRIPEKGWKRCKSTEKRVFGTSLKVNWKVRSKNIIVSGAKSGGQAS